MTRSDLATATPTGVGLTLNEARHRLTDEARRRAGRGGRQPPEVAVGQAAIAAVGRGVGNRRVAEVRRLDRQRNRK